MHDDRTTDLADQDVPPELAETLRAAFGLAEPPATLDDWVTAASRSRDGSTLSVGVEALCTTGESRHAVRFGDEERHFRCILDALLVPFLLPDESPVEVRSRGPISGERIDLTVSRDAVEVTPAGAVMSFGLADGPAVPDPGDVDPALAYERVCPFIDAFPTRAAYDRWVRETPEASTMPLSFPAGLELARTLAGRPAYDSG